MTFNHMSTSEKYILAFYIAVLIGCVMGKVMCVFS